MNDEPFPAATAAPESAPDIPCPAPAISVRAVGLTKTFDKFTAVDRINLAVAAGEFYGFLGPNGAGKSTTIRMLTGTLRPTAGQIEIAGHDLAREPLVVKRVIGVLPDEPNVYERLTAREFLTFAAKM